MVVYMNKVKLHMRFSCTEETIKDEENISRNNTNTTIINLDREIETMEEVDNMREKLLEGIENAFNIKFIEE